MKTIDVRLTLTPEALAIVIARLRIRHVVQAGTVGTHDAVCRAAADAMEVCAQRQRIVREAYEAGHPLTPQLKRVFAAAKLLPLPGEGKS